MTAFHLPSRRQALSATVALAAGLLVHDTWTLRRLERVPV